jgi:hypothetical protein
MQRLSGLEVEFEGPLLAGCVSQQRGQVADLDPRPLPARVGCRGVGRTHAAGHKLTSVNVC